MFKSNKKVLAVAVAAGLASVYGTASAQTVIGNWEAPLVGSGAVAPANIQPGGPGGTDNAVGGDGWVDWQNTGVYSLSTIGATNGTNSLKVQTPNLGPFGSFVQDMAISLNANGYVGSFLTSGVVAMDVTWNNADWSTASAGAWGSAIDQMALNASNNGSGTLTGFTTVGNSSGHASTDSGRPAGDQFNGYRDPTWFTPTAQNPNPAQTITATLTWDMSAFVDGNAANGEVTAAAAASNAGFVNFIFATNFDNADEDKNTIAWYIDNVRLLPRVVTSGWQGGAPDPDGNSANGNSAANNWYASLNWANGVPGVKDSVANLGTGAGSGAQVVNTSNPVTLSGLTFDNTGGWTVGGTGTFTMSATSNTATISVASGNHTVSNPVLLANDTTVTVTPAGNTLTLSNLLTTTHAITKAGAGSLAVNTVRAASLNITAGTVSVITNGSAASASQLTSLTMTGGTTLDLNDNDMVVGGGSASILLAVKNAYHNGAWDQSGITSSSARITSGHTALAVASGADYMTITGSSTLDGLPITGGTAVKYTYTGDANLDGKVTTSDFALLAGGFGTTTTASWVQGDFNYDGTVNALDFNMLAANYGAAPILAALPSSSLGALVPEPTGLLLMTALIAPLRRRRARA